jgi:hypothetical protein
MVKSKDWPVNGLPPNAAAKMIAGESLWGEFETSAQIFNAVRPISRRRVRSRGLFAENFLISARDPRLAQLEQRYKVEHTRIQREFQQALIDGRVFAVGVLDGEECRKLILPELFIERCVSLPFTTTEATRLEKGRRQPLYRAVRIFNERKEAEAYVGNVATTVSGLKPYGPKVADFVADVFDSSVELQEELNSEAPSMTGWLTSTVRRIQTDYENKYGKSLERTSIEKVVRQFVKSYSSAKLQPGKQHLKIAR